MVEWRGSVLQVRVVKIENSLDSLFEYVPDLVGDWLRCVYGV